MPCGDFASQSSQNLSQGPVKPSHGFTLIEFLVVISIISLLSSVVFAATNRARERSYYGTILSNIQALKLAPELYFDDIGFYPPDVGREWDPGFMQPLPFNPDTGASSIPACSWCPPGWDSIATARWRGPYLSA